MEECRCAYPQKFHQSGGVTGSRVNKGTYSRTSIVYCCSKLRGFGSVTMTLAATGGFWPAQSSSGVVSVVAPRHFICYMDCCTCCHAPEPIRKANLKEHGPDYVNMVLFRRLVTPFLCRGVRNCIFHLDSVLLCYLLFKFVELAALSNTQDYQL